MITTDLKILRTKSTQLSLAHYKALHIFERLDKELKESTIPGLGLTAIQINIPYCVSIIRMPDLVLDLYNMEILEMSEPFIFVGEGCLSLPGKIGKTRRYNRIKIRNGDGRIINATDIYSTVIQHEFQHQLGELFIDHLAEESD